MPASASRKARRRDQFHLSTSPSRDIPAPTEIQYDNDDPVLPTAPEMPLSPSTEPVPPTEVPAVTEEPTVSKQPRYILFVGNLPQTATVEGLRTFFASLRPAAVRLATDKESGQGRGFAFVEFADRRAMEACLSGYHGSVYRELGDVGAEIDGTSLNKTKGEARRINIELTAGGGGGSEGRRRRLRDKNDRLGRERAKRSEKKRMAAKLRAEKRGAEAGGKAGIESLDAVEGMHPSRRARMGGAPTKDGTSAKARGKAKT